LNKQIQSERQKQLQSVQIDLFSGAFVSQRDRHQNRRLPSLARMIGHVMHVVKGCRVDEDHFEKTMLKRCIRVDVI